MELPARAPGDVLLPSGEMLRIRERLRALARHHDLTTVIAYAFDRRTRILPTIFTDLTMAPAGVRAIGSALLDSGFDRTRIVLQQWNRNFAPSEMRLDGRIPDLFLVSSLHLHSAECDRLIEDACRIDPARRPLIIAGGPRAVYAPWEVFSCDPDCVRGADVAVTGEEYVLLSLLETLLTERGRGEPLRSTFQRVRNDGGLDGIPGLVYGRSSTAEGPSEELVDTGIQRLLGNLDELPSAVLGYGILEPPGRRPTLAPHALPTHRIRDLTPLSSVVLTSGCKLRCSYCPIPAYNQRQHRTKSGERVAEELGQITQTYGIVNFFGTDDNFFDQPQRALEIAEVLARRAATGRRPYCKVRYATEATVHDTLSIRDHLPLLRRSGLRALLLGVEDMTATLIRKGQSEGGTLEAFRALRENGIVPMPMMMHHDSQPLLSASNHYGLINQVRLLRKAGALYMQLLVLTPAQGSRWFAEPYESGLAFESVGGARVEPYRVDGNYVVASNHPRPWTRQLNLLAAYAYFFNPLRALAALLFSKSAIPFADAETNPVEEIRALPGWKRLRRFLYRKLRAHIVDAGAQVIGMWALARTARRTLPWAWRLLWSAPRRTRGVPRSPIRMRDAAGGPAAHDLPGVQAAEGPPDHGQGEE